VYNLFILRLASDILISPGYQPVLCRKETALRKVIVFNMLSVDGYFEGLNRDINWHNVDEEFNDFAIEQLNTAGTLLFGRVTYQLMESYWPTPDSLQDDPIVAGLMNQIPKFVFSKSLESANWQNTTLVKGDAAEAVTSLKELPGKDMFVFGSGEFVSYLAQHDLIDEYRLIFSPILLGRGNPLFKEQNKRIQLKLAKAKVFKSGNVLLYYQPIVKE
jgi:dihydrofolate reductase